MNIDGKHIVLTGAASGIGRALLAALAAYQTQILAVDIDGELLADAAAGLASVTTLQADLATQEGVDATFAAAGARMGTIDIFIANAGFAYYEIMGAADWEHIARIYRLNVFSPIYAAQKMKALYGDTHPYRVVITASAMAKFNLPGYSLYGATKGALDRFSEAYRYELPAGSRLQLVYPIATTTRFFDNEGEAAPVPNPNQTPEYVAKKIVTGIERDWDRIHTSFTFQALWALARSFTFIIRIYQGIQYRALRAWYGQEK
jgi:uncharacterized protein